MARMIDPSELEGDDLANWYQRSPADVEAEREAARQDRYDAFVKSIGAPAAPQADNAPASAMSYDADQDGFGDAHSSDGAPIIQARYYRPAGAPPMAPIMEPPSGPQVGPPADARGGAPIGPAKSGFFGAHRYVDAIGGYYNPDLPNPLNFVTQTPSGWWQLGDGSLAPTSEVERIYGEQQRRLRGEDDPPPPMPTRVVDNLRDGQVPRADLVTKGQRELDPTCHPYGGWERDPGFDRYSQRTKQYETQITHAPGLDYVVRIPGQPPVKFDGCAVWNPRHPLLEAKGPGYASLLDRAAQWGFYGNMLKGTVDQAGRQRRVAPDQRVEWHVAEPGAMDFFQDATYPDQPPIVVNQTPARFQ
jgi:hypothetical protein